MIYPFLDKKEKNTTCRENSSVVAKRHGRIWLERWHEGDF